MPLTLLIVEDDPAIALALNAYFETEGYGVVSATTGEDALDLLPQYHPHLLIADITLPHMDGYDLVRKLRKLPAYRLLPVILLTARGQVADRVRGYQFGCDVYLSKPFDLVELSAVVRNLLDRHQIVQSELQVQAKSEPERERKSAPEGVTLTGREQEVLTLLCRGLSNRHIGQSLMLSPRTVEKYVSRLFQRTQTTNRADLVRYAVERQLVERQIPMSDGSERPADAE
jgi:DNA-binding NarL/FixJ family response regulator